MSIVIPIMNQHPLTIDCLNLIEKNSIDIDEVIIVDNSEKDLILFDDFNKLSSRITKKIKIVRNKKNIGVRESLNQGYKNATGEIVLFVHNDLMIYDYGFDGKIKRTFEDVPEVAMVGAFGAKGLGTADIYLTPYNMNQLVRNCNISNARMDKNIHGFRNIDTPYENVAVFDGMFMAIRRKFLEYIGGFDEITETFHNYDNLMCIKSLENGFENVVIPLDVDHLGGRTTVAEDWSKDFGKTKTEVHIDAHPPLWEYGKGKLPIFVDDIFSEETGKIIGYELFMNRKSVKTRFYN